MLLILFFVSIIAGEVNALLSTYSVPCSTTVVALSDGWGYTIGKVDLQEFLHRNPGINLSFLDTIFIDTVQNTEKEGETKLQLHDLAF